jgi:hypothetical protein
MRHERSGVLRRQVLNATLRSLSMMPVVPLLWIRQAAAKAPKVNAHYQDQPNGPQHCEVCAYYVAPVGCKLVVGEVSPNGWCSFFHVKNG